MATARGLNSTRLLREAAISAVFVYLLIAGGTLNGLALFDVVTTSIIVLGVVGLAWLGSAWWSGRAINLPKTAWVGLLFLVIQAASTFQSLDPRRSLNGLTLTVLYVVIWALVADLISEGWSPRLFPRCALLVATPVIALALWQTIQHQLRWVDVGAGQPWLAPSILRPRPILTSTNIVAAFLNLLWPLSLVRLLGAKSWPRRIAAGLWTLLAWLVLLLTSSRGAWIGAAAGLPATVGLWWLADRSGRPPGPFTSVVGRRPLWIACAFGLVAATVGLGLAGSYVLRHTSHTAGFAARRDFWVVAWGTLLTRPILGLGPDTYATAYLRSTSVPPRPLYVHAHNQVMNLVAETGIVGLFSGTALTVAAVIGAWNRWHAASREERETLAGVGASLVATAVHGLFDLPTAVPVTAVVIAAWIGILTVRTREPSERRRRFSRELLALTALVLFLIGHGAWSQCAYQPYLIGIIVSDEGRYEKATGHLERALARDPQHSLYNAASGFAHGMLAYQGHPSACATAIDRYKRAILKEPGYALNYANLGTLYHLQANRGPALESMEAAVSAAPSEATFWLNLGLYREEAGQLETAEQAYRHVFELREKWTDASFWRETEFRRSVVERWHNSLQGMQPQSTSERAEAALASSHYEEALSLYEDQLAVNPGWAGGHAGRAEALLYLGRYDDATQAAGVASFLSGSDSSTRSRVNWILAEIAHHDGDLDRALKLAERAVGPYRDQDANGPAVDMYGWAVFYRLGPRRSVLPMLVTIRLTDREVDWLVTLGTWYAEAGELEKARSTYREALEAAPDCSLAAEHLAELDRE